MNTINEQAGTTCSEHVATSNQSGRDSAPASSRLPGAVLIPAAIVAAGVLLLGFVTRPPQFTARAAFVVDWNRMPSVPGDETVAKMRNTARKELQTEIETLPWSDEISDILDEHMDANADPASKEAAISRAENWLSTTLVVQTNDCDRFVIEMSDADPHLAESVVKCVLQESVSRYNTQARIFSALAAARAKADLAALDEREARSTQSWDSDSRKPDPQRVAAGTSQFKHLVGVLDSPVQVVEKPHLKKQRMARDLRVLFSAFGLGGVVGIAGIGLRKLAEVGRPRNRLMAAQITSAPRGIPALLIVPPKIT